MYQYKARINRKVSSCSFHYAEIFGPNQNMRWKFVLPKSENRQKILGDLPYFALKCHNFPKGLRKKAECPNEAYFLVQKI